MKKVISTLAVVALFASLLVGCGKKDAAESEASVKEQAPPAASTNWTPETTQPADDHSGHDHGDHGHAH